MKRFLSAFAAVVFTASLISSTASESFASYVYDDSKSSDDSYYCIVRMSDDPLAKYDYAKQNGVNEFIFTEEGKAVYEDLKSNHASVLQRINEYTEDNTEIIYDYTSVYNGFSIVLKNSEYQNIWKLRKELGIDNIYQTELYYDDAAKSNTSESKAAASYTDLTDRILEETGISKVQNKGDSTLIAVIDNEFDLSHEFLTTPSPDASVRVNPEDIENISPYLSATSGNGSGYYLNEKVPYRFNYASHTNDTSNPNNFHGTHVAGIAAGNGDAETDAKYDAKGAAPNAQLALMSSDLYSYSLMAAYDDCAYIGADVVNASYGASFTSYKVLPHDMEAIDNMSEIGILFCAASGNESKIEYSGKDSLLNTDYSSGGYPNGISSVFTVGSAGNTVSKSQVITSGNSNYKITPAISDISTAFDNSEMEFEIIPGMGYPEDFDGIDVKGKIAVISRGEITFDEKAQNAKDNGAVGVIFYNNVPREEITPQCNVLPSGMISYESGQALISSEIRTVIFCAESQFVVSSDKKMNDFSSWDFTEELTLKPDITAFGGNIISSYPGNKYGSMSGTSMATPQVTGMAALLKEYLKANSEKYGITDNYEYSEMIARLLMSTATPVYSSDGLEIASPRVQGSGLANVENAINTPAYLYTDSEQDNFRPKLSLGDNLEKNLGTIQFSADKFCFHIKNISDTPQTYKLSSDVFRDNNNEDELAWNVEKIDSKVSFMSGLTEINEITVGPGEDAIINLDLNLSAEEQQYIEENFENGTFIDGYIYLKSDSSQDLVLPFMGFYGSWSDAGIFEPFVYSSSKTPSFYPSLMADANTNIAGVSMIAGMFDETISGIPLYSPNGDNVLDNMCLYLGFKRRCRNVNAEIYSNSTGKRVYMEQFIIENGGWNVDENLELINMEYPINWNFSGVSDGEIYELRLTAETPLYEQGNGRKEIMAQEFKIDITAPKINECRKLTINGDEYLQIKVSDNNAIQGAVLLQEIAGESEPELLDVDYCINASTKNHFLTLALPENSEGCYAEIYDMAGNCVTVDADGIMESYNLTYDENMFFSTREQTFKNKISLTDSNGKDVNFSVSPTPKKAFDEGISEVSVLIDSLEIASIPVSVGLAGDSDINGVTDLYDAIRIAKYILWKTNPNGAFKTEFDGFEGSFAAYLSDYDVNGEIDLYDAIGIAKTLMPSAN